MHRERSSIGKLCTNDGPFSLPFSSPTFAGLNGRNGRLAMSHMSVAVNMTARPVYELTQPEGNTISLAMALSSLLVGYLVSTLRMKQYDRRALERELQYNYRCLAK
ncbi:hypothetical protein Salat_2433100 [Sesamum alatum]|uniref:Uncharacterized protein n=1 Tax=Sesamum alatum TaxID=300844 RepID=A0AAE1XYD1_9LAMI|nr:hypothetical protein Salat_2433100 [Sesamum alatum]